MHERGELVLLQSISGVSAVLGSLGYGMARLGKNPSRINLRELSNYLGMSMLISLVTFYSLVSLNRAELSAAYFVYLVTSSLSLSLTFLLIDISFSSQKSVWVRILVFSIVTLELLSNLYLIMNDELEIELVVLIGTVLSLLNVFFLI